ncbi:MAG TPA: hypothetical protein VLX64_00405, partial [Thermoplasmata archaeon]|nr:hypothetical protein [Thermoplasmata archaeon]
VGGAIQTQEGVKAARLRIGRKARVSGPLVGGRVEIDSRARVEDVFGDSIDLGDRAEARRICAANVRLRDDSEVDEVLYTQSIEMGAHVRCRSPPRKVETLPAFPL